MDVLDKDPVDTLDYLRDWSEWLAEGDTVLSSTWTVDPDGVVTVRASHTDTTATVWLSGGETGQRYAVTNTVTTAQGRTAERTFYLYVRDL